MLTFILLDGHSDGCFLVFSGGAVVGNDVLFLLLMMFVMVMICS